MNNYTERLLAACAKNDIAALVKTMFERKETVNVHVCYLADCLALVANGQARLVASNSNYTTLGQPKGVNQ